MRRPAAAAVGTGEAAAAAAADGGGHPSKKGRGPSVFANALAGGVSGMIATCVAGVFTSPLQRASTLLSIQDAHPSVRSGAVKPYANTFDCIARLQTEQGFYSLWRGFGARVAFSLPKRMIGHGVSFATKDHIKSLMPKVDKSTNFAGFVAVSIITGGLGGILPLSLLYPIDHALFRIQTDIGPGARAPAWRRSPASSARSRRAWYTAFGASLPGSSSFEGSTSRDRHARGDQSVPRRRKTSQLSRPSFRSRSSRAAQRASSMPVGIGLRPSEAAVTRRRPSGSTATPCIASTRSSRARACEGCGEASARRG